MTLALQGKHALVTGAGQGIGESIAAALVESGATVTLMGRTEPTLLRTAETLGLQGKLHTVVADVTDESQVNTAFAEAKSRLGPVDILINNAGQAGSAAFEKTDAELWRQMLDVNLTGVYYCCRAAITSMRKQGWGRIINIASTAGIRGYPYVTAYCASKHGVIGLTRSLSLELAKTDVTVNAVCPGFTNTAIVQDSISNIVEKTGRSHEQALQSLVVNNPQKRLIEPEEVASTVLWLCSNQSHSITGQSVAVAGGEVM